MKNGIARMFIESIEPNAGIKGWVTRSNESSDVEKQSMSIINTIDDQALSAQGAQKQPVVLCSSSLTVAM